ncbi:peptidoglycan-binding protein [Nostocaceae cyanobacterium CENA369]|uniref:Peptidoglycan-binding protein n=1 Tax=Dendronalium phyllosphericum CENA369 TaxID=1725256 RepID=A0A8J7IB46_9NOST|nr:peptidoglycan-binding protein [Dendronalium phyllosphericum]MBH8576201.1 peptidoglycan-binding protein [Dendronalium phyllosphericum CENA369]
MRLCHSSILIFTCFTCLGFYPTRASTTTPNLAPTELAQASSKVTTKQAVLKPGSQGSDVRQLQTQLKKLGYYKSLVNGYYSPNTRIAVAKFQKAQRLKRVDGIADLTTRWNLQAALAAKTQLLLSASVPSVTPMPKSTTKPKQTHRGFIWWSLLGLGILGSLGAIIFLIRWFRQLKRSQNSQTSELKALSPVKEDLVRPPLPLDTTPKQQENTGVTSPHTATASISTAVLPPEKTSRLPKLNVVDELMKDLHSTEPKKRRKAIWNLGHQGDSRAIQPLVDLMLDADSQERSLILAALAEISTRTLKPLNRALAISMQDESPQVRQNAIRDLTRVYDMMSQMNQMLSHALEDSDTEVQSTARYALTQMNKLRSLSAQQSLPESLPEDTHREQGSRGAEEQGE